MALPAAQTAQIAKARVGLGHYQRDPVSFWVEVLGWPEDYIWDGMRRMARSVRDNQRTAIRAGHGVSKTFSMSGLALWFLYSFPPATVVTTAPTQKQVEDLLWREIRQHHAKAKAPLFGETRNLKLDLQPETGLKWFATGFSTRPDTVTQEATAFHGYHNDNVLVIFDEAAGILPEIWRAAEHIGGNRMTRFVAVGNPTSSTGDFVRCFKDPDFAKIVISVKDTPNYIDGTTRIPGLYGRDYEARIISKYGKDSDDYRVRVLGEISQKAAPGAYYAETLQFLRDRGRVADTQFNSASPVYTVWDPGYTTAIWFFQIEGRHHVRFVRYYEGSGIDMAGYARILKSIAEANGYVYAGHFAPFDVDNNQYKLVSNEGLLEIAAKAGIVFRTFPMERSVQGRIERTRAFLKSRCSFIETPCELGLDRLAGYQQAVNRSMSTEDEFVFMDSPAKNGCDHGADAMGYASLAIDAICGSVSDIEQETTADRPGERDDHFTRASVAGATDGFEIDDDDDEEGLGL